MLRGVSERQRNVLGPELRSELRCFAVEGDRRTPSRHAADFHIPPGHAMVPSRAEGFHSGLFGSKAARIALHTIGFRIAVANLAFGKNAVQEPLPEARDG